MRTLKERTIIMKCKEASLVLGASMRGEEEVMNEGMEEGGCDLKSKQRREERGR
jgi:hypothetical protein